MMRKFLMICAAMILTSFACFAQAPQALELDKDVRVGKLDNGLTYYIRHNEKPQERASFYLVTDVGAIQETPAQDGLAHFLEHMCLNGTKNFPEKGIISYMESIGASFGANINAYTSIEHTAYILTNIPIKRNTIIDSAIFILHDYSQYVTNDPKEIDAERGVIIEEWRTRRDANQRNREALYAALFKGSKYATCNLIGTQENLATFKPEELVSFYKTWYRPDMQAVIVVGDVDVDYVESKIKEYFNQIPKAVNPKAKDIITVPDNEEPIVSIFTDKELSSTSTNMWIKYAPMPKMYKATEAAVVNNLARSLVSRMMNERLDDESKKLDAKFLGAGIGFAEFVSPVSFFTVSAITKDGEGVSGFRSVMEEVERARKYGFTQEEYDRAKTNILKSLETRKNNADSRQNESFCGEYVDNFVSGEPYLTPEYEYEVFKKYMDILPLQVINQMFQQIFTDNNRIITYTAPEKEGLAVPAEQDFLNVLKEVKDLDIKPLENSVSNEPLLDVSKLKGSKIKKEAKGEFGSTIYTLNNGIKVVVKPTDYKKDEVIITTEAEGGKSVLPLELLPAVESTLFSTYQENEGLSKFTESQLSKMLTGKNASASKYLRGTTHGVSAYSAPSDLETTMQLIYLNYTDSRAEQDELEVGLNQIRAILPNAEKQPNYIFSQKLQKTLYNSPRQILLDSALVEKCNVEKLKKVFDILYSNAAGTTVFITGNVNLDTLKPLICKYIGSIPVKSKKGYEAIDHNLYPVKGVKKNVFDVKMETPKTKVAFIQTAYGIKNSLETRILMDILNGILDQLYTKTIREDEGGTYGVGVSASISGKKGFKDVSSLYIGFDTDYEKSQKLIDIAKAGLKEIAEKGPNAEYLAKSKENIIKQFPEKQIHNSYWHGVLNSYYTEGIDDHTTYIQTVEKVVNSENIQNLVKQLLAEGNLVEVIMNPEKK